MTEQNWIDEANEMERQDARREELEREDIILRDVTPFEAATAWAASIRVALKKEAA